MSDEVDYTGLWMESEQEIQQRRIQQMPMPVAAGTMDVPETLFDEPPAWNRIEMQSRTNMCAPHGGTTAAEVAWFQATGELLQFSRNFCYARAQIYCGLFGDRGVTLGSVIKTGLQDGFCLESLMPFNGMVDVKIRPGCVEDAVTRRIKHTIDVRSGGYAAVRTCIGQNFGAVLMATLWKIQYWNGYIVESYRPLGRSGHARAWLFLSTKRDNQGRPYVWCANSHSDLAQHNGYELWSPAAIDDVCRRDSFGITGVSAMTTPKPQFVNWNTLFG